MKRITFFTLMTIIFAMITSVSFSQAVANGDFEAWDSGLTFDNPTDWESPNAAIALFSSDWILTQESADAHGGMYSAYIEAKTITVPFVGTYDIPGILTLGDISVNQTAGTADINGGVPFTDRPDQLEGFYKFVPVGTDQFLVEVVLLDYDDVNEVILDTIGVGYYTSNTASVGWEQFIAPITYSSTANPNYMNITILSTNPGNIQVGSGVYVDDLSFFTSPQTTPDLFFSEYMEGSSYNKALEIYNGTGAPVDLSSYIIGQAANGGGWAYYHNFPPGSFLADNDVWVMVNDQISSTVFDVANADEVIGGASVVSFNGNDARAIMKIVGNDTIIIDQIGDPLSNPGDGWDVAGTPTATKEHTIVRKPDVTTGNPDYLASFGTDANNSEWIVGAQNDASNLGFHNTTGNGPAISIVSPSNGSTVYTTDVTVEFNVANFAVGNTTAGLDGHVHYSFDGGATVMIYDTNPIPFTGLALGQHTMHMWLVDNNHQGFTPAIEDSISFEIALNSAAEIVSFEVPDMIGFSLIDNVNYTVIAIVPLTSDLTNIIPTIGISSDATIDPASGVTQDFTNPVIYTVTAQDGTTQAWTVTVAQPAMLTVSEIQGQAAASPFDGQTIITSGIVTGVHPNISGYFIQNGPGAWNGIFVYDNVNMPAVGDDVTFMAKVAEYYDLTELKEVSSFMINSSGNALPAASVVTSMEVNDEMYEGVLVRIENAECITVPDTYNEWTINDGSGEAIVDNEDYTYMPTVGLNYAVQGPLTYSFGAFKIQVRDADDIVPYAAVSMLNEQAFNVYPNPATDVINITDVKNNSRIAIYNVLGDVVYSNQIDNNLVLNINAFNAGVYFIKIENNNEVSTTRFIKK